MGNEPQTRSADTGATTRTSRPQFFVDGGPLSPNRTGYVERAADRDVWNAVGAQRFVNLTGAPKSGKTSLLLRLAHRLRESAEPPRTAVIELKQLLQREGHDDVARCFYAIAFRLARQLRVNFDLQAWWADNAMLPHHLRFLELFREFVIASPGKQIVLLFDDSGDLVRRDEGEPLLNAFRMAFDARTTDPDMARLTIVYGSTGDAQFGVEAAARMPHAISTPIQLEPFTLGETLRLAPALGFNRDVAEFAMQRIYDWAAGQPSMTQNLAARLARQEVTTDRVAEVVDALAVQLITRSADASQDGFIGAVSERVLHAAKTEKEQMLIALGQVAKLGRLLFDSRSIAHDRLLAVGLVRLSPDGFLVPGSRILRRRFNAAWVNRHLPIRFAGVAAALALFCACIMLPLWYTAVLPAKHVRALTDIDSSNELIESSYRALSRLPGFQEDAVRMLNTALAQRFAQIEVVSEAEALDAVAARHSIRPDRRAEWWRAFRLRQRDRALRAGDRLGALAALFAIGDGVVEDEVIRAEISTLLGTDFDTLRGVLSADARVDAVHYSPRENWLVSRHGLALRFWKRGANGLWQPHGQSLSPAALRTAPQDLRFELPAQRRAGRLEVELVTDHPRPSDLLLTLTGPSGDSASVTIDALPGERWRIADIDGFAALDGVAPDGIWSMTIRDQRPGVTGATLVARLGGREAISGTTGLVEDPTEVAASETLVSSDARFAIAIPETQSGLAAVRDLSDQRLASVIPWAEADTVIGFATRGSELVINRGARLMIYRLGDGRALPVAPALSGVANAWLSDGGDFVAAVSAQDGTLHLAPVHGSGDTVMVSAEGIPQDVAVSRDGQWVAILGEDRVVRVWSVEQRAFVAQLPFDSPIAHLEFQADQLLIYRQDGGARAWSPDRLGALVAWDSDALWSSAHDAQTGLTLIGSARDGFRINDLSARSDRSLPIVGLTSAPMRADLLRVRDGLAVLTEPDTGTITIWEPDLPALSLGELRVRRAWLSDDGKAMAFSDARDSFTAIRLDEDIAKLTGLDDQVAPVVHSSAPELVRFSPDGKVAISAETKGLFRVHDVESVTTRDQIGTVRGGVSDLAFDHTGERFAVASSRRITVHGTREISVLASQITEQPISVIAWDAWASSWMIGQSDGSLLSWNGDNETPPRALHVTPGGPVQLIETGLRTHQLAFASEREIRLFDQQSRSVLGEPLLLPVRVDAMQVSADGRYLVVRAGQWLYRVFVGARGLTIRDQRLMPAGALRYDALVAGGRSGEQVLVLAGLDEPELHALAFDFSDQSVNIAALPENPLLRDILGTALQQVGDTPLQ